MKMDCRQIEELMMDYLYQELDADQTSAYRAHLSTCASCGAQLAGYERTRLAVRELPDIEPPLSVTERLLQEAARRPVRAVEPVAAAATVGARGLAAAAPGEGKGVWAWLTGWMQPIFAHPGFAAAAAVVIVGGVAGLLAMRGKLDLSAPRAAAPVTASASAPPAPEAAAVPAPAKDVLDRERAGETGASAGALGGTYAETSPPAGAAAPPPAAEPGRAVGTARLVQPKDGEKLGYEGFINQDSARRQEPQAEEKKADKNMAAPAPAPAAPQAAPRVAAPQKPADVPAPPAEAEMDESLAVGGRGAAAKKEAKPSASVPLAHEASRPAKSAPAPKPSAESALDDDGVEGGVVGGGSGAGPRAGVSAGDSAPSAVAAAPPPPPAPATKAKAPAASTDAEAKKLHGQAKAKANVGDCTTALKLRDRIYRVDPAYFERSVRNDADLGKCTARKKATESRDAKSPAPSRDEVPALSK